MKPFTVRTQLLPYQQEAISKLRESRVGALFADMGTGKTRMAIELARIRQNKISCVVWFCPVSLKLTCKQEILKHTDSAESDIYVFSDRTNERNAPLDKNWYVCGIESLSASNRVVFACRRVINAQSMVVCDESTYIKTPCAKRTLRADSLSKDCLYRLILTGTPLTNGEQDLYAQMHFLSPIILGYRSFYSFARCHVEYSKDYPGKIIGVKNTDYLASKIAPYVYQITKKQALSLPDKFYCAHYCALTAEQEKAYEQAKNEFLDYQSMKDDWDSIELFRLFTALQSIVCGFWNHSIYNGSFKKVRTEKLVFEHERIGLLTATLHKIPPSDKVIIWAKFRHCIEEITSALKAEYGENSVAQYHGGLSELQRESELNRFRNSARFLVGTQSSGSHGLTLTEAHYAIFYANGFKFSERLQAEDRCHRIGQSEPVTYIDLLTMSKIDFRIQRALEKKEDVLTAFMRNVEAVKKDHANESQLKELIKSL